MRASVYYLLVAISTSCSEASERGLRAENLFVPHLAVLPPGVGQMLPMEAYRTFASIHGHGKKHSSNATKFRRAPAKHSVRRTRPSSSLAQIGEQFAPFVPKFVHQALFALEPESNGPADQEQQALKEALSAEKAASSLKAALDVEVRSLKVRSLKAEEAVSDAEHAVVSAEATVVRSSRKPWARKAWPSSQSAVDLDSKRPDSTAEFLSPTDKHSDEHSAATSLKAAAKAALTKAETLERAAEVLEVQATGETTSASIPSGSDATVHATISSKTASEAVKVAIDAAQTAAKHANAAQKAADTVNAATASHQTDASSSGDDVQLVSGVTTWTSAKLPSDGTPLTPTGATEDREAMEKQTDTPSSGSVAMAVPAQVTEGMHIPATRRPDEAEAMMVAGETKDAVVTQAANDANKMAQEAAKVAQHEAFKAADLSAQAAAVTATAAKDDALGVEQGTKTSAGAGNAAKQAEKVADKAQEAQEAAIRATAAAKVAEQKAEEAKYLATEAAATSVEPTTEERTTEIDVPAHGAVFALVLGAVISVVMFSGLMGLFACGDIILQGSKKDVARASKH